ncbi:M15 family metallopeptidase [Aerococcus sp. 1KP-2016]|uniref:M15 family metallopeptidase n=1 Tax=Aerococcus sp. 1KP-2016 TaxID=1981982 RepID=UPI000B981A5C|nr:M15 family metallopeptidase [Aerococcus sp. 1KP-2016]OYQ66338.1 D-alanyl-D-alanine carboxypeptidase [Aerococcus sp. 1KP-2016]
MSDIKFTRFHKVYLIVVLLFILAIGLYDVRYKLTNRQVANSSESSTSQVVSSSQSETVNSSEAASSSTDDSEATNASSSEDSQTTNLLAVAETITTPVAVNATTDQEASDMAAYSADYAGDIQSYTVAEIANSVATQLGISQIDAINQLVSALPKDVDLTASQYQMVNKLNPLATEPVMTFAYTANGKPFNAEIEPAYTGLIEAATQAGYTMTVISGHRTIAYQVQNVQNAYNIYLSQGYSEAEALELTNSYYAPAEASEHSTGLAFDLLGTEWTSIGGSLDEGYASQPSAQWLADNAQDYGFILRYPDGKDQITGYLFEPWHYRYVGIEAAQYIHQYDLTLEEFYALVNFRDAVNQS